MICPAFYSLEVLIKLLSTLTPSGLPPPTSGGRPELRALDFRTEYVTKMWKEGPIWCYVGSFFSLAW